MHFTWFTNPHSTNQSSCISFLVSCYMFRLYGHHQGADILLLKLNMVPAPWWWQCSRNMWELILCFVDGASLYNLFQMKPTRCTLLLSIFISTTLHVSINCVPIIRRTYCICATMVIFTVWVAVWSADQYRTDTVSSSDDGHTVARNMYRSWNKHTTK